MPGFGRFVPPACGYDTAIDDRKEWPMAGRDAGAQDGPYTEPENSTVDDWHGQELAREQERADELMQETGGDAAEAERRFEQEEDPQSNAGG